MLKDLILSITNRCNLRCRMCDIPLTKTEEVPTHVWLRAIEDAVALGATTVVFSGGEPLLREDLFELITTAKKRKMMACVTSNGILLDEVNVYRLLSAGVDVVNVSLEGPPEVHDLFRGKGSYEKALAAIRNLKKFDVECTIATVVTAKNYEHLPYIVRLAKEYKVNTIKFQPFSGLFLIDPKREDEFFLPKSEVVALRQKILEAEMLCREHGIGTNPSAYFQQMVQYLVRGSNAGRNACPALDQSCPINARGEVYPCWVLSGPSHQVGSLHRSRLSEIWNSEKHADIVRAIKRKGCRGCLMSCYDDNFGGQGLGAKLSTHFGALRQEGPRGYFSKLIHRWKSRFKFYAAWRGSPSDALRRINAKLVKELRPVPGNAQEDVAVLLEELNQIKQRLAKESESVS